MGGPLESVLQAYEDLPLKFFEKKRQWANLAELYIGLLKETIRKDMKNSDSPLKF